MTLDVFAEYWLAGGAVMNVLLLIVGRYFLKSLKIHEIITVVGTIQFAWPFILIYIAMHQNEEGKL
jgi:hypothetical protein